jgi:hypothetical protein
MVCRIKTHYVLAFRFLRIQILPSALEDVQRTAVNTVLADKENFNTFCVLQNLRVIFKYRLTLNRIYIEVKC